MVIRLLNRFQLSLSLSLSVEAEGGVKFLHVFEAYVLIKSKCQMGRQYFYSSAAIAQHNQRVFRVHHELPHLVVQR